MLQVGQVNHHTYHTDQRLCKVVQKAAAGLATEKLSKEIFQPNPDRGNISSLKIPRSKFPLFSVHFSTQKNIQTIQNISGLNNI